MTQNQRYIIKSQLLLTGLAQDTVAALNLPLVSGEVTVNETQGTQTAFIPQLSKKNKFERISSLLNLAIHQSDLTQCDTPILWLLPQFNLQQEAQYKLWLDNFKNRFPKLYQRTIKFLPYGRASMPMALKYLADCDNKYESVCILAVDSLYFSDDGETVFHPPTSSDNAWVPSEGVGYLVLERQEHGLEIRHSNYDSAISQEKLKSIENLFSQQSDFSQRLSYLYLPGNGNKNLITPWVLAYQTLERVITLASQIIQTGFSTAELGCVTGLYNFMHIYDNYQQDVYQGDTLQLEISDNIYSSVALYRWMSKE